jgi:hypothetical protein
VPNTRTLRAAALSLTLCVAASAGAQEPAKLEQFLRQTIGLDSKQIEALERGETVTLALDTQNKNDVAVFGITTTRVPRETLVRQMRDFPTSLRSPNRPRFGIFGNPATLGDVADLTVEKGDVGDLQNCRPSDCKFKLPASEIGRVRQGVNWSAPDVQAQVTAYTRQRLVDYVTNYRAQGDSAMVEYDGPPVVRASDAFAALLQQSPYVYQYTPSLMRYLQTYPQTKLDGASELIFWSEDTAPHLRKILSLTHLVLYSPPELPGTSLVASKQIYADHYFEAAFDLTTIVDRVDPSGSLTSYVLVLRRYRFDYLPSGGLLNIRKRAVNGLKDQLAADLGRMRESAEHGLAVR